MLELLQRARTLGTRFFHRFGIHCATHQIRVILISCVVITSLFYPALAIYSSQSHSASLSILGSFVKPSITAASQDLLDLWSTHATLRVQQDAVFRARCRTERTLRVERILIQSPFTEDEVGDSGDGALNHQILLSTLRIENQLEDLLSSRDIPCLNGPDGNCFVLSPLAFWQHDKELLVSDTNILDTLGPFRNVSVAGIPVTPHMVLAGRGSNEHHVAATTNFDFATFLALTYFFPETECLGTSEHMSWLESIEDIAVSQNAKLTVQASEPSLIALHYDPHLSGNKGWSAISTFIYLAYTFFFAYVTWSMRRMDAVHSRIGLTFTALVEIAVSTITSLSVCALVGFKVTMVPWELLPIVIVFVGAENMFNLVDAVGKTSVTLPVKQRIAEGLSRAGTSNTLKVVSYNIILGVIAVFAVGAIRQFCVFAIVVLVAHWFLAHTFFMAVLSIDIQRLELDELLRQNSSLTPVPDLPNDSRTNQHLSKWQKLVIATKNMLRGRATKNISLLLLLAITATLYYTTYPASGRNHGDPSIHNRSGALSRTRTTNLTGSAYQIWKLLNPKEGPLHLRIEAPTILTFQSDISIDQLTDHKTQTSRPWFSIRTLKLILWLLKIVVLPITVTTSGLYGLLLYLLKNAELLEAQRNRAEPDSKKPEDEATLEGRISFSTLSRGFATDVELIAASKDGQVVVCVGMQNEVVIWRLEDGLHISIDATDVLLRAASTSAVPSALTSVAMNDDGSFFAVGTAAGIVGVWAIEKGTIQQLPHLVLDNLSTGVIELHFVSTSPQPASRSSPPPSTSEPSSPSESAAAAARVVAVYENGVVAKWEVGLIPTVSYFTPPREGPFVKSTLLRVHPDERLLVAYSMDDGTLQLTEVQDSDPLIMPDYSVQAGNPADVVSKVHVCRAELDGSIRVVVGVATEAGAVSLWDGLTGECISVFEDFYGRVNNLRVSPVHCERCHFCGELPLESFSITFSVDHVVRFFKAFLSDQTRRCSCTRNQPRQASTWDSLGRRSRSNSTASSIGTASPSLPRARLSTAFETSPFPVSGHGVHSRRASEKDASRRNSDTLAVPLYLEEYEPNHTVGPLDNTKVPFPGSASSFWQKIFIVRAAEDVTCERGGWGVSDQRIVGVRRKPRAQGKAKGGTTAQVNLAVSQGLTSATLERWELWVFDPSGSRLQSSPLATLTVKPEASQPPSTSPSPSHSASSRDIIARLPFTRVSPFVAAPLYGLAGFGNTVGVFNFTSIT